ncbi:hypothetical protein [Nocardioides sp. T2.26MG-1]|uniref:hypothetical protein n=1 Tax=Nocardioides sp. T2.26MG-1 TaxID=3041166 RepID=UPI002477470B|nr:hypothetical protein [Nocardioides sp. T2.26MG-1]CAI9406405.1 hypothetical protein HIDPHFAB_04576 [Nocardioides sp. T2.26MG-1]
MDDASWAALTLSLTVLGGIWTWLTFRRRGLVSALRPLAVTLLPLAAYLTKTLRMFTRIFDAVGDWALNLAWNPTTWAGIVVAGVSGALFAVSTALRSRGIGTGGGRASKGRLQKGDNRKGTPAIGGRQDDGQDDGMAEIEALLRKRGIN